MLVAGRYRLVEQIGRGGMGAVWRAEDTLLGREVAVKVLTARPEADPAEQRRRYERMRREARSAASVSHRNVIVVHDIVEDAQGLPCIVMELVRGRSLADRIREDGPLAPAEAARVGGEVLAALCAAHGVGVLHRDVKPANVLLAEDGRVVLTDFGIAVWAGASSLTQSGELAGSAGYIAPERLHGGGEAGPASDLWALGALLFCAVEGRSPFERPTALEEAYATVAEEPHPMRRAGALAEVVEGLLAKDPQDRLSAVQAARALGAAASEAPTDPAAARPLPEPATERAGAGPRGRAERPRRQRRVAAAAAAGGVALVAVAALAWGTLVHGPHRPASRAAASASASPTCGGVPSTVLPTGDRWARYLGATFAVPAGWRAKVSGDGQQVDFIDPTDRVRLTLGRTDLAGTDPVRGWQDLEPAVRKKLADYQRLRLQSTCQDGRPAAVWEFTWQGSVPYRAIDLGWSDAHQNGYGLYLSAPAAQWPAYQPVFDTAVATIRTG